MAVKRTLVFMSTVLQGLGALLLGCAMLYVVFAMYQGHLLASDALNQALVDRSASSALATAIPTAPALRIRIPSIDLDAPIVEVGTLVNQQGQLIWETPKDAVGHHQGTADPGPSGNVVLSGHISSPVRHEGNVFSRLPEIELGAVVFVETSAGTFSYRIVSRRVVEPTQVDVMDPTSEPTITLITCYPDWVYSHRLVLSGTLVRLEPSQS